MYLLDTNVISENRKGRRANAGLRNFFKRVAADQPPVFLSVVTVGELRLDDFAKTGVRVFDPFS